MTMSDWVTFVRLMSPYVLYNSGVHDDILALWSPLRQAAVYFLDYREGQHDTTSINAAQDLLAHYARLCEKMVPDLRLNTIQLHNCVFHLPQAVHLYGPSIFRTEFWVERLMQIVKRITKHRCCCSPELVAVGAWLLKCALAENAQVKSDLLAIWNKIDPSIPRFTEPDVFDGDGNAITSRLIDENDPDSTKVGSCNLPSCTKSNVIGSAVLFYLA
jgi:hypothetical protein